MANNKYSFAYKMRILHRYLGFFMAGIMAIYAISGIVLIFRDTDALKRDYLIEKQIKANASPDELSDLLKMKRLEVDRQEGSIIYFNYEGSYNQQTGEARYTVKRLPYVLDRMTHLHKAKSSQPLFVLNIIFGLTLLFFVLSAFWMFAPGTTYFKKGMYFTAGGLVLALVLLFV